MHKPATRATFIITNNGEEVSGVSDAKYIQRGMARNGQSRLLSDDKKAPGNQLLTQQRISKRDVSRLYRHSKERQNCRLIFQQI